MLTGIHTFFHKGVDFSPSDDLQRIRTSGMQCAHTRNKELIRLLFPEHAFAPVAAEPRCCVNVLEPDARSTEFLEPGRAVSADEVAAVRAKVAEVAGRADVVTFNGSVPAGCGDDIYRDLVEVVRTAGKPAILDTSGKLLVGSLAARPAMIKPNTDEIQAILGRKPESIDEIYAAAREVHETYGIEKVVVSLGGDGSVMACSEGVFRGRAPKIEVVNPVGSGDTMVGAFAVAMARGMAVEDQLAFAMACASANCLTPSTGHFDMAVADELRAGTSVEKVA